MAAPAKLNPATVERLVHVAAAAEAAGHGGKEAVYAAACAELGMSRATLLRSLAQVSVRPQRKRRSDAGAVLLPRVEAEVVSALLMDSHRKNNKRLMSIGHAVGMLRANGEVRAEYVDEATGEVRLLGVSAIARALRQYGLHPDQLLRPAPAKELRSLHPNHVWQIDASLCVLYYLETKKQAETGLQIMQYDRFYKNKPAHVRSIENKRVWSYEVTDHNSGAIFVHYVLGAESGANLAEAFIAAIQQRGGAPFYGVPQVLMMDMGSANTSGLFKNLARRLGVELIAHAPGNPRATGQVECARNIIETSFESGLKLRPVGSLEELNEVAQTWANWFNGNKVHSRHGRTRYEQWMTIREEQLRIAPPVDVCRELLNSTPEKRKVSVYLRVSFGGQEYDVSKVPGVQVGEQLAIARAPYAQDAALVVEVDADGHEALHTVPLVQRLDDGFAADANVIGEDYARHADTRLQTNRKLVERIATDAATDAQAEEKRKAKAPSFGGRIDPYKHIEAAPERTWLPRKGGDVELHTTTASAALEPRTLSLFEAAKELAARGVQMTPARNAQVRGWYPDGRVPEADIETLAQRLERRANLQLINGGAQ